MLELAKTLMYGAIFSAVVPLVLMFICKKRIKQRYFIWLGLLITNSFLTDLVSLVAIKSHLMQSNVYLVNFHHMIQFILLLLIYRELYLKEKKLLILTLCLTFFGFEIVNSIYVQKLNTPQTWTKTLSGMIFLGLTTGYFAYLLKTVRIIEITSFAPTWINMAILFYFGFSLYLFAMAEYVFTNTSTNVSMLFWSFHNLNNIFKNCLFAVGISFAGHSDSDSVS